MVDKAKPTVGVDDITQFGRDNARYSNAARGNMIDILDGKAPSHLGEQFAATVAVTEDIVKASPQATALSAVADAAGKVWPFNALARWESTQLAGTFQKLGGYFRDRAAGLTDSPPSVTPALNQTEAIPPQKAPPGPKI